MAIIENGGFNFKNANGQLTRKMWVKIENHTEGHKLKVTIETADVQRQFSDGGLTWQPFQPGNGGYEPTGDTPTSFAAFKTNHAADLVVNVHTWYPEGQ